MLLLMGDDGWCLVPAHPFCNRKQNGSQLLTILHCGWSKKLMIFLGDFNAEGMQRSIVSEITQHGRLLDQSCVSLSVCLCVCKPVFCKANSNVSSCSRVYQQLYPLYQHFWAARATPNPYCPRQPNANDAGAQSVTDSPPHPPTHRRPATTLNLQPPSRLSCIHHLLYRFDFFHNNAYKQIIGFKG